MKDKLIPKARLSWLLAEIKNIRMEAPVAEIANKTGYNKSTVSEIVNNKISLSEKFLRTFCQCYGYNYDVVDKGIRSSIQNIPETTKGNSHIADVKTTNSKKDKVQLPLNEPNYDTMNEFELMQQLKERDAEILKKDGIIEFLYERLNEALNIKSQAS